jgi:hypothetical protein
MAFLYRKLIPLLLLALALFATGCGSDDDLDVPSGAVAVVGEREIPKSEFDALLEQAEANFQAQKQEFPQAGTPEYENLKNSIVRSLVERAQWEQKAGEMGIQVTDAEVTERLDGLKEQSFQGDEEAYRAELEKAGLTEKQLRDQIRRSSPRTRPRRPTAGSSPWPRGKRSLPSTSSSSTRRRASSRSRSRRTSAGT